MSRSPDCFTAGIVKGVIESNDPYKHFGSLGGFIWHLETAVQNGLVEVDSSGRNITVTDKGKAWYVEKKLKSLPSTRAYAWQVVRDYWK